jgi:hypothetical protein
MGFSIHAVEALLWYRVLMRVLNQYLLKFRCLIDSVITAVIPAYNEAERIAKVIAEVIPVVDEVIVVDDGSDDETARVSQRAGAAVITLPHAGYVNALRCGFQSARGEIIVTLDADGEHDPCEIPSIVAPILEKKADLVLGSRTKIPSVSEGFISVLVKTTVAVNDHGTGFRGLTKELAETLHLKGRCTCGTLVLEAASRGATIVEVPVTIRETGKKRRRKWVHLIQIVYVLYYVLVGFP